MRIHAREGCLLVMLFGSGCAETTEVTQQPASVEADLPRLSRDEVLSLADAHAATELKSFDLNDYPARSARFDPDRRGWWVRYEHFPIRHIGDHFGIWIDDATGEIRFFGGR